MKTRALALVVNEPPVRRRRSKPVRAIAARVTGRASAPAVDAKDRRFASVSVFAHAGGVVASTP
jgi:hypothetical protein